MKVADLIGNQLDYWVAKANGLPLSNEWDLRGDDQIAVGRGDGDLRGYAPSRRWNDGGPILESNRITVTWDDIKERFWAELVHSALQSGVQRSDGFGPTYLIAGMRAYVASKFGQEVPDITAQ